MVLLPFSICKLCFDEIKFELAFRAICGHFFHSKCASKFLDTELCKKKHCYCPYCHQNLYSEKYSPYFITIRHRRLQLPTPTLKTIPECSALTITKEEKQNVFDKYLFRVKSTYPLPLLKKLSGSIIYNKSFEFMNNIFTEMEKGQNEDAMDNAISAAWFFSYLHKTQPKMKGLAEDELKILRKLIQVIENVIAETDKKKEKEEEEHENGVCA